MNIIFLTDLDGTMLSNDNFSCDSIKNDIINLLESGIIIIFNSSKTRMEIENISKSFGVIFPYICENGGEFILPELQANEEKKKLYNLKLGKEYRIPTDLSVVGLDFVSRGTSGGGGGGY